MQPPIIAPSILSAKLANLGEESRAVLNAGADWIHFDVMDNHYVPNLTFGPMLCEALRDYGIKAPIDVHLMVKPVDAMITAFAKAGASVITFHPEATEHVHRSLNLIKELGCQGGLAINPATPIELLKHLISDLDIVLLMSVNPGFSGQRFIPSVMEKIKATRRLIEDSGRSIRLAVDGGINIENIASIAAAGADTFIAGSAIFKSDNYQQTINAFRKTLATLL